MIKKYTLDINETYFAIMETIYKNDDTGMVKVKGFFAYKKGQYKDFIVEGPKVYTFPLEVMQHWKEIKE